MAEALDLEPQRVSVEVSRLLQSGYIGEVAGEGTMDGLRPVQDVMTPHLLERGARAVRKWPTDDPFDALIEVLDQRIQQESDEEQRTRLRRLRTHLLDVGKGAVGSVLVELGRYGIL